MTNTSPKAVERFEPSKEFTTQTLMLKCVKGGYVTYDDYAAALCGVAREMDDALVRAIVSAGKCKTVPEACAAIQNLRTQACDTVVGVKQ